MKDRSLVTAFRPLPKNVRASIPRNSVSPPVTRICSDVYAVMFGKLEAEAGSIVIRIVAAVRERGLHGFDREMAKVQTDSRSNPV